MQQKRAYTLFILSWQVIYLCQSQSWEQNTGISAPIMAVYTVYHSNFHNQKGKGFLTSRLLGAHIHNLHLQVLLLVILSWKQQKEQIRGIFQPSFPKILQFNTGARQFVKYPTCPIQELAPIQVTVNKVLNEYTTPKHMCLKMQNARCTDLPEIAFLARALDASG